MALAGASYAAPAAALMSRRRAKRAAVDDKIEQSTSAMMRWLALPGLSLNKEFSAALNIFLEGCSSSAGKNGGES